MTAVVSDIKTSYGHGQDNGTANFLLFLLKKSNFVFTTKPKNNSLKAEEWGVGFSPDTLSDLPPSPKKKKSRDHATAINAVELTWATMACN